MFVDDVSFNGKSLVGEWKILPKIIKTFSEAPRLCMNEGKSILLDDGREDVITKEICDLFGVASSLVDEGFTYVGF